MMEAVPSQRSNPGEHMAGDMKTLVAGLNGAPIERTDKDRFKGYFTEGLVTIENIFTADGRVRFELCFPTARGDNEDYIFTREREAGTTDKVRLMRAKTKVDARIVAIRFRVEASEHDEPGLVIYFLTFEGPRYLADAWAEEPLQVEFTWTHKEEEVLLAVAHGTV